MTRLTDQLPYIPSEHFKLHTSRRRDGRISFGDVNLNCEHCYWIYEGQVREGQDSGKLT